ncbi:conserved hypothetical protein [Leishmania infantum JPCM5]|uniref:Uncharacterized protein n=2 Tax=Leishmania infantum TaxID=5671 RepID=A4I8R3_LEIIN|nr:conserved hypothetical protein [Leishmania infantum JPCM5]CAC9530168.1 hypothetical_protein_-_conserved [Leishmania infantum]CAM71212.1 conserved hypothetical protein [Leishmania infantum JPCM5]SUZ45048.1 hypothetical_protein_-_conserved [Leishmania infantum]|eukprot:XP_001468132.1 conserved hypothetical protein [Leishmania infantum JPCM5]
MEALHYELWDRCTSFVASACAGRDASHGLGHMRKVTEQAILLYLMDTSATVAPAEKAGMLYRIILVGMLHDVADHKYDVAGALLHRVKSFAAAEAAALVAHAESTDPRLFCVPLPRANAGETEGSAQQVVQQVAQLLLTSLDAISYSKEVKRGMRWFVPALSEGVEAATKSSSWVAVRDYVSDADKLESIGEDGLLRCYEYTCVQYRASALAQLALKTPRPSAETAAPQGTAVERQLEAVLLREVVAHFHEKLKRLLPVFIVTSSGKHLGIPRAAEMAALLEEWQHYGPPPVTMYWRNAAAECTPT